MPRPSLKLILETLLRIEARQIQENKAERYLDLWRKSDTHEGNYDQLRKEFEEMKKYLKVEYYENRGFIKKVKK